MPRGDIKEFQKLSTHGKRGDLLKIQYAREYVANDGVGSAAVRKIYPHVTRPDAKAWALMKDPIVIDEIERYRKEFEGKLEMNRERIMAAHTAIATSNIANYIDENGELLDGKRFKDLPEHIQKAVAEMTTWKDDFGKVHTKIKLWNKQGSLDSAAKIQGLFKDTPDVNNAIFIVKGRE